MPTNVVKTKKDEKHWSKAKAIAAKSGHSKDWAYIMGIYQKMSGKEHAKKACLDMIGNMIINMDYMQKDAGIFDKLKNIGDALAYDLRLALKFPGERAFQKMLRRYDKKKIRWLTRELKRLMRGQRELVERLSKAESGLLAAGPALPPPPRPPVT